MFAKMLLDKHNKNKLLGILSNRFFIFGSVIKLISIAVFTSEFIIKFPLPFVDYFVNTFANPYSYFFKSKSDIFPYPALMLYVLSFFKVIINFFTAFFNNSIRINVFLIKLPLFFADLTIFIILSRFLKNQKKVLIFYWFSPVLFYINYFYGQLDAIPIAILFVSLYFLFKDRQYIASFFLALSATCKTHILIVVPFYFLYLFSKNKFQNSRHDSKKFALFMLINFILFALVFVGVNIPFIFEQSFLQMVFVNKEQFKVFNLGIFFNEKRVLYVIPFLYFFLLINAINVRKLNKDIFMMFLAFAFGVISLTIPPNEGWYYWIMPFFIYFYVKESDKNRKTLCVFFLLQLLYFIYFCFNIHLLFLQFYGINTYLSSNLIYTALQGILTINCWYVYKFGFKRFQNYKILSKPFLIGIAGDSGAGKTTVSKILVDVFSLKNTTVIQGDAMHKWERGHENWQKLTHLNPKSNLLYDELFYLKKIKNGEVIYRREYDHCVGRFTELKTFYSNSVVIFEGLHSFYLKQAREIFDLKIFIKPSEELRKNWKIERDTATRGYSKEKILQQIEERKSDSEKFIQIQEKFADIVVEMKYIKVEDIQHEPRCSEEGSRTLRLVLKISNIFYLEELYKAMEEYLEVKYEYTEENQVLEVGGNITKDNVEKIVFAMDIDENLAELGIANSSWQEGYFGVLQLVIAYITLNNK